MTTPAQTPVNNGDAELQAQLKGVLDGIKDGKLTPAAQAALEQDLELFAQDPEALSAWAQKNYPALASQIRDLWQPAADGEQDRG